MNPRSASSSARCLADDVDDVVHRREHRVNQGFGSTPIELRQPALELGDPRLQLAGGPREAARLAVSSFGLTDRTAAGSDLASAVVRSCLVLHALYPGAREV
jgi:hypothetical protein